MKQHHIRKEDERRFYEGNLLAMIYNASPNRDTKRPQAKGSDFYLLSTEKPKKFKWKASRKEKGAIELPKKLNDKLDRRFTRPTL